MNKSLTDDVGRLAAFNSMIKKNIIFQAFPSVYDSISGMIEFGPYGATMKNNLVSQMRKKFRIEGFWEVDCPLVSPVNIWQASGHMDRFTDIIADSDSKIYRVDKVIEEEYPDIVLKTKSLDGLAEIIAKERIIPKGNKEPLKNAREYSLMLLTSVAGASAVIRPETATTTYLSFKDYNNLFRAQMPIKLFQYGRVLRNEITSRQGLIRCREFDQLEAQIFILENEKNKLLEYEVGKDTELTLWSFKDQKSEQKEKTVSLEYALKENIIPHKTLGFCLYTVSEILSASGIQPSSLRFRQHLDDEKAHYALDAWDVEVLTEQYGWVEVCGVHDRGDYDLKRHQEFSKKNFSVKNANGADEIPHVLEIAFGVGRLFYCMLEQNYELRNNKNVLKIPKEITPLNCAVFPLINKDNLVDIASSLNARIMGKGLYSYFDSKGSIGKRYARMDEIGTPYCLTVDFNTQENNLVTIRDRDTTLQKTILLDDAPNIIRRYFND